MLILSDASLKYAVDVCLEKKSKIIIVVENSFYVGYVSGELEDIIFDSKGAFERRKSSTYTVYSCKNGSTIMVIKAGEFCRGYRANTVIVQQSIFDTTIVNQVFGPIETLDEFEIRRPREIEKLEVFRKWESAKLN